MRDPHEFNLLLSSFTLSCSRVLFPLSIAGAPSAFYGCCFSSSKTMHCASLNTAPVPPFLASTLRCRYVRRLPSPINWPSRMFSTYLLPIHAENQAGGYLSCQVLMSLVFCAWQFDPCITFPCSPPAVSSASATKSRSLNGCMRPLWATFSALGEDRLFCTYVSYFWLELIQ